MNGELNKIDEIKGNYDLSYEANVSALTHVDIFSFFNLNEVTDFIVKVPYEIRSTVFDGRFNAVKLLSVPVTTPAGGPVDVSYLSEDRLTGTSMENERNFTTTPQIDGDYFPPGVL